MAHARIDIATCLEAPTRDCVLRIAVESGQRNSHTQFYIQTMLHIANISEASGDLSPDGILSTLMDGLARREPELSQRLRHLSAQACRRRRDDRASFDTVARRLIHEVRALHEQLTAEGVAANATHWGTIPRCLGVLGQSEPLDALINQPNADADAIRSAWIDRLVTGERFDILENLRVDTLPEGSKPLIERAAFGHLARQDSRAAVTFIETMPDPETRRKSLYSLSQWAKTAEDRAALLPLAQALAAEIEGDLPAFLVELLAEPKALAGDWQGTLDVLARVRPGLETDEVVSQALARLGGARGEYDVVKTLLRDGSGHHIDRWNRQIVGAAAAGARAARRSDLDILLAELPDEALLPVMMVTVQHAIERGDVATAHRTYVKMWHLDPGAAETRMTRDSFALWLAERGDGRRAMALDYRYRDAVLLARIAMLLD